MRSFDAVNAVLEGRAADTTGTPVGGAGETDVDSSTGDQRCRRQ